MPNKNYIRWFQELSIGDIPLVGGKNASLGEMYRELTPIGVNIPDGFAVTAEGYFDTLEHGAITSEMREILRDLNTSDIENLQKRGKKIRDILTHVQFPSELEAQIVRAYRELSEQYGEDTDVAVRSSATAEDLPEASFAGQQESFLNIRGEKELLATCKRCFASLFTDRALSYRVDKGFDHFSVGLSVGVQKMVRSDMACAGVMFTIDTESGFPEVVFINGAYGLGENVVQGAVNPDEFYVFKPTLRQGFKPIIGKTLGAKEWIMVYDNNGKVHTKNVRISPTKRATFVLSDEEILSLARWAIAIEEHYSKKRGSTTPMDIEWAKDGISNKLFIVQARPETVVSRRDVTILKHYSLPKKGEVIVVGKAVGEGIGSGPSRILKTAADIDKFQPGEVLVTETTDPDWEPIMKVAAAVVTDKGGRTSHAAIVSRELGIPCVVGTGDGTRKIELGSLVTVSCAEGDTAKVYKGLLPFEVQNINIKGLPKTRTEVALNVGDPEIAFRLAALPQNGVGLARIEFVISSSIGIHPCALLEFDDLQDSNVRAHIKEMTSGYKDKVQYFVDKLAQGVGRIAAAFYPKPVIVRMSDFKSNEYANLLGGEKYEPQEENPMIGWRGASRYYSSGYKAGFRLECLAMKKAREEFGLTNIKLMIPFCRTTAEAKKVIMVMAENGLVQKENGLEIYGMCEVPSNVLLAEEFLDIFDGFSIGTNDLTQLTLGLDRDSELVADIFDERNEAVRILVRQVIQTAKKKGKYIGICGDAPSTFPEFAAFLIEAGIGTISLSPDAVIRTILLIAEKERDLGVVTNT